MASYLVSPHISKCQATFTVCEMLIRICLWYGMLSGCHLGAGQDKFLKLSCDAGLQSIFTRLSLSEFWSSCCDEYPQQCEMAVKTIPFNSTYLRVCIFTFDKDKIPKQAQLRKHAPNVLVTLSSSFWPDSCEKAGAPFALECWFFFFLRYFCGWLGLSFICGLWSACRLRSILPLSSYWECNLLPKWGYSLLSVWGSRHCSSSLLEVQQKNLNKNKKWKKKETW